MENYQEDNNILCFLCWVTLKKQGRVSTSWPEAKENNKGRLQAGQELADWHPYVYLFKKHLRKYSNRLIKAFCPWQRAKAPSVHLIEDG